MRSSSFSLSQQSIRFWTLLLCSMSCVFALASAISTVLTPSEDDSEFVFADNVEYLPQYFAIPVGYDTPRKSARSVKKSDSWVFAVVSLFESFYRRQSYLAGKLPQDQVVKFSEQAMIHAIETFCERNGTSEFCRARGRAQNVNVFEFLAGVSEVQKGLMPSAVCSYDDGSTECPGFDEQAALKWTYNVTRWGRTSQDMKEMLYTRGAPLLLSMPEPLATYYVPCSDARVAETRECQTKAVRCRNGGGYCGVLRYPAYSEQGLFVVPQEPVVIQPGEPMSFVVVGYVNSYVGTQKRSLDRSMKMSAGGFIAAAPKVDTGLPINHYMGLQRQSDSYLTCPVWQNPYLWSAANITCVRTKKALKECIGVSLKCLNSSLCDPESRYALMELPTRTFDVRILYEDTGMAVTPLFRQDKSGRITEETFNKVPFHRLSEAFEYSFEATEVKDECGYWFIPYEMIEKMNSVSGGFNNRVTALQVDISFENSQLYGNTKAKTLTSLLAKSVQHIEGRTKTSVY